MDQQPQLVDLLDFRLPDFTRLSWVSDTARSVWEPRLTRIAAAWAEVEWRSVLAGVRECALVSCSPAALPSAVAQWAQWGLSVTEVAVQGASRHPYTSAVLPVEPGKPTLLRVVVGNPRSTAAFKRAHLGHDHDTMGRLLGYPPCCRQFFGSVWIQHHRVDTTWSMAANTVPVGPDETLIELSGPAVANILWRWMQIRAVPHLPCSFDCVATVELANRLRQVGTQAGFQQEFDWMEEILSWSAEWSALHGIAEIKTPVVKVSTRTDATAHAYVVRRHGTTSPEEGGAGLGFPYQTAKRPLVTGSTSFQRGIANPIQIQSARPDWYHRDNGFSSRHAMDKLHAPIVRFSRELLKSTSGNVIDLGCGNGALLEKICRGSQILIPHGIDRNEEAVQHANTLFPGASRRFLIGDFFQPSTWNSLPRMALSILMIGRLLEVPGSRSQDLLSLICDRSDRLLVYVYPGWSRETFFTLVDRAGLQLAQHNGESVGLVSTVELH